MVEMIKAIVLEDYGPSDKMKWRDTIFPKPTGENQVLIKVKAAGVNRPDVLQRQGLYFPPADASPTLGLEIAGVVEQVYGRSHWKYGDKVCALVHGGGYAEYVWVDERHCLPIPQGWSFEEAASLPETYFTVWFNVFMQAKLGQSGPESLLVHAGASGIGVAAIQMAKVLGNRVVVTVRKEEQVEACLQLGADAVVVLSDDWSTDMRESFGSVDVVLDMLGQRTFSGNLEIMGKYGRLVWLAFLTGQKVSLPIAQLMEKQLVLTGSFLRPQPDHVKADIANGLRKYVWPHIDAQEIKPGIHHVFPIQDVKSAHDMLEAGGHVGKIVLSLG